jgi:hypothetical protein
VSAFTKAFSLAGLFILLTSLAASAQVVPLAQHVVLVVEENTSFATAYPSGMPWLVSEGNKYGFSNNYVTSTGGSLLEYLYLASGSCESDYQQCGSAPVCKLPSGGHNFFCNGNDCYYANSCVGTATKDPISDENIFHLMNIKPISWKVYVQNYLNAGGNVNVPDFTNANQPRYSHYYARHNAAVWYEEVLNNTLGSQGNVVDFEQFGIDVAQGKLPRFAIIVPDGCWDAHDGCYGPGAKSADDFLRSSLPPLLNLPDFKPGGSGLLIVTADNGDGDGPGKVYTALMGPNVKPGYVSNTPYKPENTLRTMLDSLGIETYPGWSGAVTDMFDFFSHTGGSVVVDSPANGSVQGASVLVRANASELGSQIGRMEVWDVFNGKGTKLGEVFGNKIDKAFPVSGIGSHQLVVQDTGGSNGAVLHRQTINYTRSSNYGVYLDTPANHSTQAVLFPLKAIAVEAGPTASSTGVDHLEVWNGNTKLGDSPKGAGISQWYSLSPGSHTLTVEDVSSTGVPLHKREVSVAVSSGRGVYVNSPANNSTWATTTVPIKAYAYEQNGSSTPLVDHIEVWDSTHGVKLGQSPVGLGLHSLFIDQTVTLPRAGTYQLAILDVDGNGYNRIHTAYVNITVK